MLPLCERVLHTSRRDFLPRRSRGILVPTEPTTIGGHLRRRRLQLGIYQSKAARILGVSMVTLSKWEGDRIYPAWAQRNSISAYLGYDPFQTIPDPKLVAVKTNEPNHVAYLTPAEATGRALKLPRLELQLTQEALANQLGIHPRTLREWECGKHRPIGQGRLSVDTFLGKLPT